MITRFHVENYKALRDVTLDLTPIHVLIGPNDSGKTSILEAIEALCRSVDHPLAQAFTGRWTGRQLVWQGSADANIVLKMTAKTDGNEQFDYSLRVSFPPNGRAAIGEEEGVAMPPILSGSIGSRDVATSVFRRSQSPGETTNKKEMAARRVFSALSGAHSYRWQPQLLALPVAPDAARRFRMEPSGFGLALLLDDILSYDRTRFGELETRFIGLFRQFKSIRLMREPAFSAAVDDAMRDPIFKRSDGKGIYFQFERGGDDISAAQVSDGVLLILAYLAVLYLPKPPRVLLIEEPENGIHPERLKDVLKILSDLIAEQDHTQVVMTTHSPYVVDMFKPKEVSLCQMGDDGAVTVTRLSESAAVREQIDVFTLGEIWTAEGDANLAKTGKDGEETNP